jgi:mannitol/fructose-specific phosphotransferase system IIA component (Ntr-type)
VDIAFALAAVDDHSHLNALMELVEMLKDQDTVKSLRAAANEIDARNVIVEFEKNYHN